MRHRMRQLPEVYPSVRTSQRLERCEEKTVIDICMVCGRSRIYTRLLMMWQSFWCSKWLVWYTY